MRRVFFYLVIFIIALSVHGQSYKYQFQDPSLSIEDRVENLLSEMTFDEKMTQLNDDSPAIDRLGVPAYVWWNEAIHGVGRSGYATVFPQSITMANSWNPELMFEVADVISDEARAKHHEYVRRGRRGYYQGLTFWSPNINIVRDPRWGRGHETYGEDPFLTAELGVAFVKGIQGDDDTYLKAAANAKHFAVHSGPEPLRHVFDVDVSDVDLYETYLPAFRSLVMDANVESVMGAYNRFRGQPCCSSDLLMGILRNDWNFQGHVVSDCGAISDFHLYHKTTSNAVESAAAGIKGGTDLNCGNVYRQMPQAVAQNLVTEEDVDRALRRLLTTRFKLGQFNPDSFMPYGNIPFTVNGSDNHKYLSRSMAQQSVVLLKNDNQTLPLDKNKISTIAVIGPNADNWEALVGNYNGTPENPVTLLKGIENKVSPMVNVLYAEGSPLANGISNLTPIPSVYLQTEDGKQGIVGEYFQNSNFEGEPLFTRVDDNINFVWDLVAPDKRLPDEDYSVKWTGYIVPPVSGTFSIGGWAEPDVTILLDGKRILSRRDIHRPEHMEYEVKLEKGKRYKIECNYKNWNGKGDVRLLWSMPQDNQLKNALEIANKADVIIVGVGLSQRLEGEEMSVEIEGFKGGDRTNLSLPKEQLELVKSLKETGKPVVMVLMSGGAMAINWADENLDAILLGGYPGQEGGHAIADVLFGDYNPAGKLPVTYYKSVDQLPDFENYDMKGRTYRYFDGEPLYPFGYGLSYTTFEYSNIDVESSIKAGDNLTVAVAVSNTGDKDGEEVIQVYLTDKKGSTPRPLKQLVGFKRIKLTAGESKTVSFEVTDRQMSMINKKTERVIEPGEFSIAVGGGQPSVSKTSSNVLVANFKVTGSKKFSIK